MQQPGEYPFLPDVYWWLVFERTSFRYRVGWPRMKIELPSDDAPDIAEDVIAALKKASLGNRAAATSFISAMEDRGFTFVGPSSFNFRSGTLYWQACAQLRLAERLASRRAAMLAADGGCAPTTNGPQWPEWREVSITAGACIAAARLLGYASLEAFVNEVLFTKYRALYDEYESKGAAELGKPHASVPDKLARLLKELGMSRKSAWYRCIQDNAPLRRGIEHHKLDPVFTVHDGDPDSVAFKEGHTPDDVRAFLQAVQAAFQAIHDAYQVPLPATHQPPF